MVSSIGYEWTRWQTDVPDFLMLDRAASSAITPLLLGLLCIAAMCVLFLARQRREHDDQLNNLLDQ